MISELKNWLTVDELEIYLNSFTKESNRKILEKRAKYRKENGQFFDEPIPYNLLLLFTI